MSDQLPGLPAILLDNVFSSCSPGEIIDYSCVSKTTKFLMHNLYKRDRKPQSHYKLIFAKDYSEIRMESTIPQFNFIWKFIKSQNMSKEWGRVHRGQKMYLFGVRGSDKVTLAIEYLSRIRDVFPAPVERCVIDTNVFLPVKKAEQIAKEIAKIKRARKMYVMGDWEHSVACDILLNNITVLEDLVVREFASSGKLDFGKLKNTPMTQFCVDSSTTAEQIFKAAGGVTMISIPKLSFESLNKIIIYWLKSRKCDLERLTIRVQKVDNEPVRDMFKRLELVQGEKDIKWVVHGEPDKSVTPNRLWHLSRTGVELRRADGAIATIFFSHVLPLMTFTMRAEYPDRPSVADRIPEYHEKIVDEMRLYSTYNLKHNEKDISAQRTFKWADDNKRRLSAEEQRRHNRFQQDISAKRIWWKWKEYLSTRNCEYAQKFEVKQFDTAEERRRCGHLFFFKMKEE